MIRLQKDGLKVDQLRRVGAQQAVAHLQQAHLRVEQLPEVLLGESLGPHSLEQLPYYERMVLSAQI